MKKNGTGKRIFCVIIIAGLVFHGVQYVKSNGLVSEENVTKRVGSPLPMEPAYKELPEVENPEITQVQLLCDPNARYYDKFCEDSFGGQFIILECVDRFKGNDIPLTFNVNRVDKDYFIDFVEENVNMPMDNAGEKFDIFAELELVPQRVISCLAQRRGTILSSAATFTTMPTNTSVSIAACDLDGFHGPDWRLSGQYKSGIDIISGPMAQDYGNHYRDNGLLISVNDTEIVRLITTKEYLSGDDSTYNMSRCSNTFVAIVDATVTCDENSGIYADVPWIPEAGKSNRVRFMTTCEFSIYDKMNPGEINLHDTLTYLGVYSYEPIAFEGPVVEKITVEDVRDSVIQSIENLKSGVVELVMDAVIYIIDRVQEK